MKHEALMQKPTSIKILQWLYIVLALNFFLFNVKDNVFFIFDSESIILIFFSSFVPLILAFLLMRFSKTTISVSFSIVIVMFLIISGVIILYLYDPPCIIKPGYDIADCSYRNLISVGFFTVVIYEILLIYSFLKLRKYL